MSVVVGIGNRSRGDDGLGPLVAERVAALGLPGVRVLTEAEPLDLVEVLAAHDDVVVVDALAPRGHPGRVVVWSIDGPWPAGTGGRPVGSHGIGVLEAVELARALGGLAARLTVVGVEAGTLETGATLSVPVAEHLDEATRAVAAAAGRRTADAPNADAKALGR